jgi:hypothetical protein
MENAWHYSSSPSFPTSQPPMNCSSSLFLVHCSFLPPPWLTSVSFRTKASFPWCFFQTFKARRSVFPSDLFFFQRKQSAQPPPTPQHLASILPFWIYFFVFSLGQWITSTCFQNLVVTKNDVLLYAEGWTWKWSVLWGQVFPQWQRLWPSLVLCFTGLKIHDTFTFMNKAFFSFKSSGIYTLFSCIIPASEEEAETDFPKINLVGCV